MDMLCPDCNALHWKHEQLVKQLGRFGTCCNKGKVKIPLLPEPPAVLKELLTGDDHVAKTFRDKIRQYNSALSFTSVGAKLADPASGGRAFESTPQISNKREGEMWTMSIVSK